MRAIAVSFPLWDGVGEAMRFPIALAVAAAFGAVSASAQDKPMVPAAPAVPQKSDRCEPVAGLLGQGDPAQGRLFVWHERAWKKVEYQWLADDLEILNYHSEKLRFIYVAPPSKNQGRQFLSIRTTADANDTSDRVNLRKELDRKDWDTVNFGTYQDYHRDGKPIAVLKRYHRWPDGSRSDDPEATRIAWTFRHSQETARRRVLGISYFATDRTVCVPFTLGPNISTFDQEVNGEDEFLVEKGFKIEITEAKTGTGTSGRTFTVHSPESRR